MRLLRWRDRYGTPWSLEFEDGLRTDNSLTLFCYPAGNGKMGEARFLLKPFSTSCPDGYGELLFIEVNQRARRRGLATHLLRLGKGWLRRRGAEGVWGRLFAHHDTQANKIFYERNGFTVTLENPEAERSNGEIHLDFRGK